jgi:hypothetical protein
MEALAGPSIRTRLAIDTSRFWPARGNMTTKPNAQASRKTLDGPVKPADLPKSTVLTDGTGGNG